MNKTLTEKDIAHDRGSHWVADYGNAYTVMRSGLTHSTTVQSFARDRDGLSLAVAYCDHLADSASAKRSEVAVDADVLVRIRMSQ